MLALQLCSERADWTRSTNTAPLMRHRAASCTDYLDKLHCNRLNLLSSHHHRLLLVCPAINTDVLMMFRQNTNYVARDDPTRSLAVKRRRREPVKRYLISGSIFDPFGVIVNTEGLPVSSDFYLGELFSLKQSDSYRKDDASHLFASRVRWCHMRTRLPHRVSCSSIQRFKLSHLMYASERKKHALRPHTHTHIHTYILFTSSSAP